MGGARYFRRCLVEKNTSSGRENTKTSSCAFFVFSIGKTYPYPLFFGDVCVFSCLILICFSHPNSSFGKIYVCNTNGSIFPLKFGLGLFNLFFEVSPPKSTY